MNYIDISVILLIVLMTFLIAVLLFILFTKNNVFQIAINGGAAIVKPMFLQQINKKLISSCKEELTLETVKNEILWLDNHWDEYKNITREMISALHPYPREEINSSLVGKVKVSNAFLKFAEFLETFKIKFESMFDIASPPGMFIIAAQHLSKNPFEWKASAWFEEGYLQDQYGLFFKNPSKWIKLNLLDKPECDKLIQKEKSKYDLVSGDVGTDHGYGELQEESHIEVQHSQAWIALNLVKKGGNVFLKMYTCILPKSMQLMTSLSLYFKKLYLWKPNTSRITNNETYIVGIERNSKNPSELIEEPSSPCLFYKYYYDLAKYKNNLVKDYLKKHSH